MKISIVMPTYNAEKFLPKAIESIINQTYKNWELIAVDDCSTDSSSQILRNYAESDNRIRPVFLDQNSGATSARNEEIKKAEGRGFY